MQPGPASPDVIIGGRRAWRAEKDLHICPLATPNPHGGGVVDGGSNTVFINGYPAARIGERVKETTGGPDPVAGADFTVLIGD